ncbi:MAG: trypsin-like peptidase domain-containing protein [Anaerolineae bacterium]|uniref:S1C family serine protease n=1 Tax=Promineifilum sp. TaxID=2664178 RepID=UPI001DB195EE|nr:trypsin-like peptidase domain-containing protein [Anaerolineales bacterium]MCB8935813.1 trypsin-like peptidase domain-containing protein [Promineifilum sp.]MCO5180436.1 trypsin-like peptidase domain-containing protein [Promineifilum sp.]MCW5847408.1 trypsin-like peptidase domain-containing protein [Anaerolineae bacterium]
MKQRLSILMILAALMALLLSGCSLGDNASAVLPVVGNVATTVAQTLEQQLPTVAAQADAVVQEVSQTQPDPTVEAVPAGQAQPDVIEPVPVPPTSQERALIDLYNRVNPGVVTVYMSTGSGSGFIIDADGYIVTNNHVIAEGGEITILFHDGDVKTAELVGTDPQGDIALLKVDAAPGELTALPLGDSNALEIGQSAIAIGAPFGLPNTLTTGVISGLSRAMPAEELGLGANYQTPDVIQTDAAINPGNSGGPLMNMSGEVIGVNTAIESPVRANSGVGFAVPSNVVKVIIAQLRESGAVSYPWLGIAGGTLTPDAAEELGLARDTRGVLVSEVTTGGPAAAAGLRALDPTTNRGADIIVGIDNVVVSEFDDLLGYIVQQTQVGQNVTLTILRDGQQQTLNLTLGARPATVPQQQQQLPIPQLP